MELDCKCALLPAHAKALEELQINFRWCSSLKLPALAEGLQSNTSIRQLHVASMEQVADDDGVRALGEAIKNLTNITTLELDLTRTTISDTGAQALINGFAPHFSLASQNKSALGIS